MEGFRLVLQSFQTFWTFALFQYVDNSIIQISHYYIIIIFNYYIILLLL